MKRVEVDKERLNQNMRRFRERMYELGYRQKQIWIKRDKGPPAGKRLMTRKDFNWLLAGITAELTAAGQSKLYKELLKVAEEKASVRKRP
jgi:hypothetical protein